MISVITAVYNQLQMNRLFWENLCSSTDNIFELIVIDNGSTDGSREFFESLPSYMVTVIANGANYSYPHCQNQGIAVAKYDVLAFFNNDQLVSPHWDSRILQCLGRDGYEVLSLGSNDCIENEATSRQMSRRWKRVKYPLVFLFGHSRFALRAMVWLMYGRFSRYCHRIFVRYGYSYRVGFSGSAIVMSRVGLGVLGEWDLGQQAADFDLFYRSLRRWEEVGDIRPLSVVNGIFAHHYRRLTLKGGGYAPFVDGGMLSTLESKWGREELERMEGLRRSMDLA